MAEQHRLNADTAFQSTNYQQSIDLYTKSIKLEKNLFAYMNRAIACMSQSFSFNSIFLFI
jgi:hypothetical protein